MIRDVDASLAHSLSGWTGSDAAGSSGKQHHTVVNLLDCFDSLRSEWDAFIAKHAKGSIFHTSQMVLVFQRAQRHSPLPLAALDNDGRILALFVAVRVQTLPDPMGWLSSRSIMYAEPLCEESAAGKKALMALIAEHDAAMDRQILFTEVRPLCEPGCERAPLEDSGYQFLDYLNVVIDVSKPIDQLHKELHKSAGRKIRKCERSGFEVRELKLADHVDSLYGLLQQSFAHAGVPMVDRSLFEAVADELPGDEVVRLLAVYDGETPIAMDLVLAYKQRFYVWYSGLQRIPGVSPCSIMRWHEIQWAHEHGFTIYDTGGAGWPDVPYGVRDYKSIFGGQMVNYGRYRKSFSRWRMALAERAYNWGRKRLFQKT